MFRKELIPPAEPGEYLLHNFPDWFGGMIEVAGWIGFTTEQRIGKYGHYTYTYPRIEICDNDLNRLNRLQAIVGGTVRAPSRWHIGGNAAVSLAEIIKLYTPSKLEVIFAFINWGQADSTEKRTEIVKSLSSILQSQPTIEDYRSLVTRPNFVAGVIDGRGIFSMVENPSRDRTYGWIYPRMTVTSTNRPLFEALEQTYGGDVVAVIKVGDIRQIFGRIFAAKNDSLNWIVGMNDLSQLMSLVGPYLRLRDPA